MLFRLKCIEYEITEISVVFVGGFVAWEADRTEDYNSSLKVCYFNRLID